MTRGQAKDCTASEAAAVAGPVPSLPAVGLLPRAMTR